MRCLLTLTLLISSSGQPTPCHLAHLAHLTSSESTFSESCSPPSPKGGPGPRRRRRTTGRFACSSALGWTRYAWFEPDSGCSFARVPAVTYACSLACSGRSSAIQDFDIFAQLQPVLPEREDFLRLDGLAFDGHAYPKWLSPILPSPQLFASLFSFFGRLLFGVRRASLLWRRCRRPLSCTLFFSQASAFFRHNHSEVLMLLLCTYSSAKKR